MVLVFGGIYILNIVNLLYMDEKGIVELNLDDLLEVGIEFIIDYMILDEK